MVDPVVQESLHHCLVFLVLDWDCHTVSAEVALDAQYVSSSICRLRQWSSQIEVYIFGDVPLFSEVVTSSYPGVRLVVVFLYAPWTTHEDLSGSGPYPGEPYKVLHRYRHDFSPEVSQPVMSLTISSLGTQYCSDWMVPWMSVFTRMSRSSRSGSAGRGFSLRTGKILT